MTLPPLAIQMFGPLRVTVRGEPLPRLRTRSVEWLLALLTLRHGRAVQRTWLAGTLWPESSESQALKNLRNDLLLLRKALGSEGERIQSPARDALTIDLAGAVIDVLQFDAAMQAGDEESLRGAVGVYTGPLLEGCLEEWAFSERAARAEQCLAALEALADGSAARGDHSEAIRYLRRAEGLDPLRDSLPRRLMTSLAAVGDPAAAIQTYRDFRVRLQEELAVVPDEATTRLFHEIRAAARRPAGYPHSASPDTRGGRRPAPAPAVGTAAGNASDTGPSLPSPPIPASLPRPLTSLIGRDQEVAEVQAALRQSRLVTLVGGGGVGKTRLAIQAAEEIAADFPAGVAFIELASLAEPTLLPAAVVSALGVREADAAAGEGLPGQESLLQALCGWLARHPVLLVLDNCEHLVEAAAALIHALLSACPALRILATSRQRLGITGEVVWRVPSLPVPGKVDGSWLRVDGPAKTDTPDPSTLNPQPSTLNDQPSTLLQCPSVQLFVERAAAARSGFRLGSREDAVAVARICRRLDGIPLALELAAARVALLTLPQIAARLDDRFRLLTGGSRVAMPRQQTLRALIDWSYHLLPEAERALLCRLSVFAGGWTLEAAEAVASGQWSVVSEVKDSGPELATDHWPLTTDLTTNHWPLPTAVLDLLSALEEKSLVLVEAGALGLRYRMLETVREYAREKLDTAGELTAMRQRHRDWYLQLAEQRRPAAGDAGGPDQATLFSRLEAERENLWAALAWCFEEVDSKSVGSGQWSVVSSDKGARSGEAVFDVAGLPTDHCPLTTDMATAAHTGLRLACALFLFWVHRGYLTDGLQWLEGALARTAHSPSGLRIHALWAAAQLAAAGGRRELSRSFLRSARADQEEVLIHARASRDQEKIAQALLQLANLSRGLSDMDAADRLAREAWELLAAVGDRVGVVRALQTISGIALERGDREAARPLLEERLAISRELGDPDFLVHALGALGHLARDEGDYPRAHSYYTESLSLRHQAGFAMATAQSLEDLGSLAGRMQQPERAIRLLGAAEAFCESLGAHPPVAIAAEYEHALTAGRAALGETAFAAVWAEGRAMALDRAVDYALQELPRSGG
jgi:non-specific serine/threonine protein kinase